MIALNSDEMPVAIEAEGLEVGMTEVGEMTVSFIRLDVGTDLGPALVGLDGDLCPLSALGHMLNGTLRMRTADGDHTYSAGQAVYYWAPGHAPLAETDCAYVDFSPTEQFARVIRHITGV